MYGLEAARLVVWIMVLLWCLTGTSAALLPMCLSNIRALNTNLAASSLCEILRLRRETKPWSNRKFWFQHRKIWYLAEYYSLQCVCWQQTPACCVKIFSTVSIYFELEFGAFITRPYIAFYCAHHYIDWGRTSEFEPNQDIIYLPHGRSMRCFVAISENIDRVITAPHCIYLNFRIFSKSSSFGGEVRCSDNSQSFSKTIPSHNLGRNPRRQQQYQI